MSFDKSSPHQKAMKMQSSSFSLLVQLLFLMLALTIPVQAQDPDFISIDCGLSEDARYNDDMTSLPYTSDKGFVDTGNNMRISPQYKYAALPQQFSTVRSFPQGIRHCYTLKPRLGQEGNYLIRASFMYGDYDLLGKLPEFDLHLGVDIWDTVSFANASSIVVKEIIHTPLTDHLYICLANTGSGTPFISALELRPLDVKIYGRKYGSLALIERLDMGQTNSESVRYPDDLYDRIWEHLASESQLGSINTTSIIGPGDYQMPLSVMKYAATTLNGLGVIKIEWIPTNPDSEFYIVMHFAELEQLQKNQTRSFNITFNNKLLYGPFSPSYLMNIPIRSTDPLIGPALSFQLVKMENSTLPPIINAVELYEMKRLVQLSTKQSDVDSITSIKSEYKLIKNWQGDPCMPKNFLWDGVECSHRKSASPNIISLNLTSNGLKGRITDSFSDLTSITVLDLSNNQLTGTIPEYFADLPLLKTLYFIWNFMF